MEKKLQQIKKKAIEELSNIKDSESLRGLEIKYLGRKGELSQVLRGISDMEDKVKKVVGKLANEVKGELQEVFKEIKKKIEGRGGQKGFVDVTLLGEKIKDGYLHPVTIVQNELEDLFASMGFMVLDGPELESDYYNFEALNIPAHHPARDMQDTFYVDQKNKKGEYDLVMRTHTSPMQVRAMLEYGAPLRCVVPGRVFRAEATDAVHDA